MSSTTAPSDRVAGVAGFRRPSGMLAGLMLVALVFLTYQPVLRAGFMWDDDLYLTSNPLVQAADGLYRLWFTDEAMDYYPLSASTFWLEWRWWGMSPAGYHLVNLVLHALNVLLLWLVLRRLAVPGAWLGAALFALHPVNVETVAWIAQRKTLMGFLFSLLSWWAYLKGEDQRFPRWYGLSLLFFAAAILSKPVLIALPVVLLLGCCWRRGTITCTDLLRALPFALLALTGCVVTVVFQHGHALGPIDVRPEGWGERLLGVGWSLWFYCYKIIWPLHLALVYPRWQVDMGAVVSYAPLALLPVLALLAWVVRWRERRPVFLALLFFLFALGPLLGLVKVGYFIYSLVADHWLYAALPAIAALAGGVLALGWGAERPALRLAVRGFTVGLMAVLALLTARRALVFQDEERLWRDNLAAYEQVWMAHAGLGHVLLNRGESEPAEACYRRALALNPKAVSAHANLGVLLAMHDQPAAALTHLEAAVRLNPEDVNAWFNLALIHNRQGHARTALRLLGRASLLSPSNQVLLNQMAWWRATSPDPSVRDGARAVKLAERMLAAWPDAPWGFLDTAAAAYAAAGDFAKAVRSAESALEKGQDRLSPESRAPLQHRLELYRQGKLYIAAP